MGFVRKGDLKQSLFSQAAIDLGLVTMPGSVSVTILGTGLPAKKKHQQFKRTIPKDFRKQVRDYSILAGEILWAWNRVHATFAAYYGFFLGNPKLGYKIWHAFKTDGAQRVLLKNVLYEESKKVSTRLFDRLEWLILVADALTEHRNDIVHVPMLQETSASGVFIVPDIFAAPPKRVQRLGQTIRSDFHKKLRGDLIQLSFYARALELELWSPGPRGSLPDKPVLQSIRPSDVPPTLSQKLRRERRQSQRRHQRKALRK